MEESKEPRDANGAHAAAGRANSRRAKGKGRRSNSGRVRMTIYLSAEVKEILEQLQLRSLDKQGRKPEASEVIGALLRGVVEKHKATPYPGK